MQHIKSYMVKIDSLVKDGFQKKQKKDETAGNDKNIRIVASYVKGIRESREAMLNAK